MRRPQKSRLRVLVYAFASLVFLNCASRGDADNPAVKLKAKYERDGFLCAAGYGSSHYQAEQNALGALIAVFGQSVKSNLNVVGTYREGLKDGIINISKSDTVSQAVESSASMDSLIGAEIAESGFNGRNYYALAVMNKAKARDVYSSLLNENLRLLDALLKEDKSAILNVGRYYYAAALAEVNGVFINVLSVLDYQFLKPGIKSTRFYKNEAENLARKITITLEIEGDKDERVKQAFAYVFSAYGFKTGSAGDYVLKARLTLSPLKSQNDNKFVSYILNSSLSEAGGRVLLPFSIDGREGHITERQAEERTLREIVERIKDEYNLLLIKYFTGAL